MNVGFFYVKNHGILQECIDNVLKVNKEYYSLLLEEKMKLYRKTLPGFTGFSPVLDANTEPGNSSDMHEEFDIVREDLELKANAEKRNDGSIGGANTWPEHPEGYREATLKYHWQDALPTFAAMDLSERYVHDKTRNPAARMSAAHYPPQIGPVNDRVVGIGVHTDFQCFTILWQQPLQVLNSDNKWIDAIPIDGTLVIKWALLLLFFTLMVEFHVQPWFARWTNDVFKSTVHRVVNRNSIDRYSIPLFFGSDDDVNIEPIASCISAERPARYEPITAGEYVNQCLKTLFY
ncbi:hypothetical protein AZE42_06235 [Rhizopogon vesiculosus]|uniref:Fe2OG dioxygenase domain-containing protein n=1 Tax=Rhizopogon vesiculosus TaxID=180088 RepID=A0A1J8QMX8_9AGAM|nr:hypothetical protein AZE42_06235 [Rhizopogon vesiculosus]